MKKNYPLLKLGLAGCLFLFSASVLFGQADIFVLPVDGCNGEDGELALSDQQQITYDIDIYGWDPVAMTIIAGPNMNSSNPSPSMTIPTPDPMSCSGESSPSYEVYWVQSQATFNGPNDGTQIQGSWNVVSYPSLTTTIVPPDCAGTTPSIMITGPDGTVCFNNATTATAGYEECGVNPIDGVLEYSYVAFAGTACETTYANTITASCDGNQCGGPICDITIVNESIVSCDEGAIDIIIHDINGGGPGNPNGYDPAYVVDLYIYDAAGTQVAGPANLSGIFEQILSVTPDATTTCDPELQDYTVEVVCSQDPVGAPGTNLTSIPFSITVYPSDPTCPTIGPEVSSGPGVDDEVGCVDEATCDVISGNVLTISCPAGFIGTFSTPANATLANYVDNEDGTFSIEVNPDCAGEVQVTLDCICATGGVVAFDEDGGSNDNATAAFREAVVFDCPFGFGEGCVEEPLPVELISFEGYAADRSNILTWASAAEINAEKYAIQRSDDSRNWETIGNVQAAGFSQVENFYAFEDVNPDNPQYYRLAMLDFDGLQEFSNVIIIRRDQGGDINVYPNPITDNASVDFTLAKNEVVIITLIGVTGNVIRSETVSAIKGDNSHQIDMSSLAKGLYFISMESSSGKQTKRIIKS